MKVLTLTVGLLSQSLAGTFATTFPPSVIEAVGWLEAENKQCTATLVSSHQVLTAAHCLYDTNKRRYFHPNKIQFFAGFEAGEYRLSSFAKDYTVGVKKFPKGQFDEKLVYNDWALITLSTGIGCSIEPIALDKKAFKNQSLSTLGYGNSDQGFLSERHDCQYALPPREKTALRLKNCDIESGYSGGPLLRKQAKKWYLVGLISAETEDSKGRERQIAVPKIAFENKIKRPVCRR